MVKFWPIQMIMSDVGNSQALLKRGREATSRAPSCLHWLPFKHGCELNWHRVGEAHSRNGSGKTEGDWVPDPEKPPSQPWEAHMELLGARETPYLL